MIDSLISVTDEMDSSKSSLEDELKSAISCECDWKEFVFSYRNWILRRAGWWKK